MTAFTVDGVDLATVCSTYVRDESGVLTVPGRRVSPIALSGSAGALLTATGDGLIRSIDVTAILRPSPATAVARRTAEDLLKDVLSSGLHRFLWDDGVNSARVIDGAIDGPVSIRAANHPIAPEGADVAFRILCRDAYWKAAEPTLRALAVAATRYTLPLGTAPSSPIIRIMAATNPVLTYRSAGGTSLRTMTFTVTLASTDYLDINMQTRKIVKYASGTASNGASLLTSGDFPWAFDPADGDVATSAWPTLEVSTGTAEALYWKSYP